HCRSKCSSSADRAILASNGERIPPCGVPVSVSSLSPSSVRTPDFRKAFTSAQIRLSLILARRRSVKAVCEISSKDSPTYYVLRGLARGIAGVGERPAVYGGGC